MIDVSDEREGGVMTDRTSKNLSKFPRHGWKVKLDHEFPEYRDQNLRPRLGQLLPLIPLGRLLHSHWLSALQILGSHWFKHILRHYYG